MSKNKERLAKARAMITGQDQEYASFTTDERLWGLWVLLEITKSDVNVTTPTRAILLKVSFRAKSVFAEQRRRNHEEGARPFDITFIEDPTKEPRMHILNAATV